MVKSNNYWISIISILSQCTPASESIGTIASAYWNWSLNHNISTLAIKNIVKKVSMLQCLNLHCQNKKLSRINKLLYFVSMHLLYLLSSTLTRLSLRRSTSLTSIWCHWTSSHSSLSVNTTAGSWAGTPLCPLSPHSIYWRWSSWTGLKFNKRIRVIKNENTNQ